MVVGIYCAVAIMAFMAVWINIPRHPMFLWTWIGMNALCIWDSLMWGVPAQTAIQTVLCGLSVFTIWMCGRSSGGTEQTIAGVAHESNLTTPEDE